MSLLDRKKEATYTTCYRNDFIREGKAPMKTRHFMSRMSQRGITTETVNIVRSFGYETEKNKIVLTAKNCKQIENFLTTLIRQISHHKMSFEKIVSLGYPASS